MLRSIGGEAYVVHDFKEIESIITEGFQHAKRIVSTYKELVSFEKMIDADDPHEFADVDLFITTSNLAVAKNGALWITDEGLRARVLPFISQQLAVIIKKEFIVATMHDSYDIIADADYGYAVFVAGPSKTADIAQSLVLGAHGPKTMTVFII